MIEALRDERVKKLQKLREFGIEAYPQASKRTLLLGAAKKDFSKLAKAKPNETVWFSYITYKSRQHRDQVNKKVMAEMDKKYSDQEKNQAMPFDMKRMSYGGFKVMVG